MLERALVHHVVQTHRQEAQNESSPNSLQSLTSKTSHLMILGMYTKVLIMTELINTSMVLQNIYIHWSFSTGSFLINLKNMLMDPWGNYAR